MTQNFKVNVKLLTRTALLLALTIIVQFLRMPQLITGSIVNAMLIISTGIVGILSGISIGLLTPIIAVIVGIMGFPALIPFIMIGNILYVIFYSFLKQKVIGIIIGSIIKFLWLAVSVKYILRWFGVKVPTKIIQMFTLPQLATALIGGIIGIVIVKVLDNYLKKART
ncbi:ECF transporter S component [Caldicellulosiruptor acetigenus]|uniref:ECF transporter S component n=1 Tax=Caldicellulosiruptor acetigenus TaxID=301953 RepID=UPI00041C1507|nr:ECF transporter S component [Caldicellulosiruptor acetigenus]WAM36949.1 ECF transporter S component [Caldicellulosiruptor acetigenus]